jgi:Fe-S-cluster containining protein
MSEPAPLGAPARALANLGFRCTGCGSCCRTLRAAVTHHDVRRLTAATGLSAREFLAWLAPDEVDMTGEPDVFVELAGGRRLMVLAQREGGCTFLGTEGLCRVHAARPRDCELWPFDPELDAAGALVRLPLLPTTACEADFDGANDPNALAGAHARRERELAEYRARVAAWNRLAARRRRFGHALGDASAFLAELAIGG